jgi:thymidylate kinase
VLTLDVTTDYRWGGRIFLTGSELLAGRHLADGIWRAAADVELAFLLVKKLVEKGDFPVHQRERIEALTRMRGDQSAAVYRDLFGLPAGGEIRTAILAGEWPLVVARTQALARLLRARAAAKHPSRIAGYWGAELGRRVRRLLSPTGVCVALLGPDGAGKSTIAAQLGETTIGPFRRVRRFHFRPRLLAGNTVDNGPGAVREPRGTLASLAKLLLYLVDVWVGYVLVIRPALCRSTLVVFDRYFHDLLVDERRYAYGGPRRLLAWACRLVPAPDLFLFVVADPVQIQERKGELTARQAEGRIVAYLALADEVGGRVIRADTADAAVLEVQRALIATMSDRAGRAAFGHRHARLRRIGRNVQPQA